MLYIPSNKGTCFAIECVFSVPSVFLIHLPIHPSWRNRPGKSRTQEKEDEEEEEEEEEEEGEEEEEEEEEEEK